MLNLEQLASS